MEDPAANVVNPQLQGLSGVPLTGRSRFVQQADVEAAAFAILKERTRPTVEKVRARLGRGSPNTIGPLLEKWFAQLADRLEGTPTAGSALDLPAAVANGARLLWHTALGEARAQAARELAGEREKLEGEHKQLDAERAQVQAEGRVLAATRAALEEGMHLAQEQAAELRAVLEDRTQKLSQADARARSVTAALEEAQRATAAAHASARAQLAEQAEKHAQERQGDAQRAAATVRHHLQEIDRARSEASRLGEQLRRAEEAQRAQAEKLEAAREAAARRQAELTAALAERDSQLTETRSALAAAQQTSEAWQQLAAANHTRLQELGEALAATRRSEDDLRRQLQSRGAGRRKESGLTGTKKNSRDKKT